MSWPAEAVKHLARKAVSSAPVAVTLFLAIVACDSACSGRTWETTPLDASEDHRVQLSAAFETSGSALQSVLLVISNTTDELVTVLWDESALVMPDGTSERIIHSGVLMLNRDAPQAPTAVAPHSSATVGVWPVSLVSPRGDSYSLQLPGECTLRLYLTIQGGSAKATESWSWRLIPHETAPVQVNWRFWGIVSLVVLALGTLGLLLQELGIGY